MRKFKTFLGLLALLACGYVAPADVKAAPTEHVFVAAQRIYPVLNGAMQNLVYCRSGQGPTACAEAAQNLVRKSVWARARMANAGPGLDGECAFRFRARWMGLPDNLNLAARNYRRDPLFYDYSREAYSSLRGATVIKAQCIRLRNYR